MVTTNELLARSVDLLSTSAAMKKIRPFYLGKSPRSGEEKNQSQQPCPTIIPVWIRRGWPSIWREGESYSVYIYSFYMYRCTCNPQASASNYCINIVRHGWVILGSPISGSGDRCCEIQRYIQAYLQVRAQQAKTIAQCAADATDNERELL